MILLGNVELKIWPQIIMERVKTISKNQIDRVTRHTNTISFEDIIYFHNFSGCIFDGWCILFMTEVTVK